MPKLHTLSFEITHDYTLVCIHTTLEDYRLAFFINKCLDIKLKRWEQDLYFEKKDIGFSLYKYNDKANFTSYNLLANKYLEVKYKTSKHKTLFFNTLISKVQKYYLIDDKIKVDFFLKISGDLSSLQINRILTCLNNIKQVITAYTTNPEKLKQKEHLIF